MEIEFTPDVQARLTQRVTREGINPDKVVRDLVQHYFQEEDRLLESVKCGEAAIKRGEVVTHEQVGKRLERLLLS